MSRHMMTVHLNSMLGEEGQRVEEEISEERKGGDTNRNMIRRKDIL